jgi:hypothetical protein
MQGKLKYMLLVLRQNAGQNYEESKQVLSNCGTLLIYLGIWGLQKQIQV